MMKTRRFLISVGSVFAAMTLSAGTAFAGCATDGMPGSMDRPGGFPERALGMIVPYGPAGGSGQGAQAMAQDGTGMTGVAIKPGHKPGGSGTVGRTGYLGPPGHR